MWTYIKTAFARSVKLLVENGKKGKYSDSHGGNRLATKNKS